MRDIYCDLRYCFSCGALLVTEGALKDLRLELAPQELAGLVLWQCLHEHDSSSESVNEK